MFDKRWAAAFPKRTNVFWSYWICNIQQLKEVVVLVFVSIQWIYLLSSRFILQSSRYMDSVNNNWDLHIRLANGSMGLTIIPSLRASFLLNPKPAKNVPYAHQTTSPNFLHLLAFFHMWAWFTWWGQNKNLSLSLAVTF